MCVRQEEEEDPEVKERKENARGRHRAWRKILLDGLDLLFELTQAAASANPADTELSQGCQVKIAYMVLHFISVRAALSTGPCSMYTCMARQATP